MFISVYFCLFNVDSQEAESISENPVTLGLNYSLSTDPNITKRGEVSLYIVVLHIHSIRGFMAFSNFVINILQIAKTQPGIVIQDKLFKVKIFKATHKFMKSMKFYSFEIFRLCSVCFANIVQIYSNKTISHSVVDRLKLLSCQGGLWLLPLIVIITVSESGCSV